MREARSRGAGAGAGGAWVAHIDKAAASGIEGVESSAQNLLAVDAVLSLPDEV